MKYNEENEFFDPLPRKLASENSCAIQAFN